MDPVFNKPLASTFSASSYDLLSGWLVTLPLYCALAIISLLALPAGHAKSLE